MLRLETYDAKTGRLTSSVTGRPEEVVRYQQLLEDEANQPTKSESRHTRWVRTIINRLVALDPGEEHTSRDLQAWTLGRPLASGDSESHLRLALDRVRLEAHKEAGRLLSGRFERVGKDGKATRYAFVPSQTENGFDGGGDSKGSS